MQIKRPVSSKLAEDPIAYLISWDRTQYHVTRGSGTTLCGQETKMDQHTCTIACHKAWGLDLCPHCWKQFLATHHSDEK